MENVSWKKAGEQIPNLPYTIWQLLWHTEYWQRLILQGLKRQPVTFPKELEKSWPPSHTPKSEQEFQQLVTQFNQQLTEIESLLNDDLLTEDFPNGNGISNAEVLRSLVAHNSYHIGQIMVLRRLVGTL
jgi:uncharacterized damage-inducible protein DinB